MLVDEALGDPLTYYAFENFLVGKILATNPPGSVTMGVLDGAFRHGAASVPKLSGKEKLLPFNGFVYYRNRTVFQGVFDTVQTAAQSGQPFFGYFHLFSPHGPYTPTSDFAGLFEDGLKVPRKPLHPLISKKAAIPDKYQDRYSRLYDQYVANVDAEIGNLLDQLETSGLLDNTYVVLLSDHGQIFERGVHGHFSRLLYDQGIHIPLVILSPGQTERRDVYVPTSNVDLVPTLVALTGGRLPDGLDGQLLPGFGGAEDEHPVFCIEAKESSAFRPFDKASFALIRGSHKLIWYSGYPEADELVELYDLKSDPREMKDLSHDEPILVKQMLDELSDARAKADAPYARSSPDR
jgi:arylsulfatase A-like enzyme